jgi:hypothetical protein
VDTYGWCRLATQPAKKALGQFGLGLPHTLHEGTILEGPQWQSRRSPCSASKSDHGPNQQMMRQKKWVNMGQLFLCTKKE